MTDRNKPNIQDKWSMSDERQFIENLLVQRVNFFIVFYSLILAGALAARAQEHLTIVLSLGTLLCSLLMVPIFRLQQKLDIIIDEIHKDTNHPATKIYDLAEQKSAPFYVRWALWGTWGKRGYDRKIIGYWIPLICCFSLLLGLILSLYGYIKAAALS